MCIRDRHLDRDLTYAITHTLFYLNDFGFRDNPYKNIDIKLLQFQLECLLIKAYEDLDVDLLLELAINYLSLSEQTNLNYSFLNLVITCLEKTAFISANYDLKTFEEKYHSLFVLGILVANVNHILNNLNTTKNTILSSFIQQVNTLSDPNPKSIRSQTTQFEFPQELEKEHLAWKIIKDLKLKSFTIDEYMLFCERFGSHIYLEKELRFYLNILKKRNNNNILWTKEFQHLKLNTNHNSKEELKIAFNTRIDNYLHTLNYA